MASRDDTYTHGHHGSVLRSHSWRTAQNSAGYLLDRVADDMQILDIGCGPGTITVDLARRVPRGSVLGIDRESTVIDIARSALAQVDDVDNVIFSSGDIYSLDVEDNSFDVVHAHQVLQHLSDPVDALGEMRRVCRPGGIVAVRDSDYSAMTWYPPSSPLDSWLDLYRQLARGNDAEPDAGRHLRGWALAAGFGPDAIESTASAWTFATAEERDWWSNMWAERVTTSAFADQAVREGRSTMAELKEIAAGWRSWGARADGWFAVLHGELICQC